MKACLALILSLCCIFGLSSVANAIPFEIPGPNIDIPKNGTGGGGGNANANNDVSNFFRLQNVVNGYNSLNAVDLPTPILAGAVDLGSNVVGAGGLLGFDYAVLHYGSGPGGTPGGGVEFFYLNGASAFTFSANGTGSNGFGGFSSLTLFKGNDPAKSVPDSGSTMMLLGAALGLIGMIRRKCSV